MNYKHIFCIIGLLSFHKLIIAQQGKDKLSVKKSESLCYAQQEIIHSKILNEERKVNIFLPEGFYTESSQHTYPVLILLEDEFFHMVSGVVKHLSSVERIPETIVVSIIEMSYIPTVYTNGSTFWPTKQLSDENPKPFTEYLKNELFPYLEKNYRANDFSMVMGLSPTSIYALHSFIKEPDLFDAHIAIAAGDILGMGYKEGERFIELFEDKLKNDSKRKRYLYVTSSDADGGGNSPEIQENLEELERKLTPYISDNFKFISKIFPNEGHYDVALPAFIEALEMIFPKEKWSARYRDIIKEEGNAMENIDNYFKTLSTEYGFKILPKAERWNSVNRLSWIGPNLLKQGNTIEAIEVIERWVEYSPESELALKELAKAYEANGRLDEALSILRKAHQLSLELKTEQLDKYESQINQLERKIAKKKN
ncbi:tetratricopeptide repeat protein [Flagellimonas sp. 389]|uniref:alpha/beta hydrolase-fold protein n=1 Tax=Flagellimonas sp. 389 TaxID=2835862 RepID=UPI001BD65BEC|nr:alpha/beta hydrolase-fold protein [Flagellimonas sp. 389]MBS9462999.1 tetratricopeptide repeat protein [Flagellimonas sp. 389]